MKVKKNMNVKRFRSILGKFLLCQNTLLFHLKSNIGTIFVKNVIYLIFVV